MGGQLKVSGNIIAAQKLQQIWMENILKKSSSQINEDKELLEV